MQLAHIVILNFLMLNLEQYRGLNRVLVVFPSANKQLQQPVSQKDFRERDLIVLTGTDELRRKFHVAEGAFTVVLIGKDGGEKLRSTKPIDVEELNATIDAMPMRKSEMKER